MKKEMLENIYRSHHERGKRYGYLYCHGERGPYIRDWVGTGKKVLDLGCRDGLLTSYFAPDNEVLGVDIDQQALELARKRLNIQTCWLDLNSEWPFPPDSFDVIVSCEIMEHLFFLDPFLKNVSQTLVKGGVFIGSVPNAFRMKNRFKFLFGNPFENDPTHVRQFSFSGLKGTLGKYFRDIEIIALQGKIAPLLPVTSKTPKRISRLFAKDLLWKAIS